MSAILTTIQNLAGAVQGKAQNVLDGVFPPEKRAELFAKLQAFAVNNPKLSVCLVALSIFKRGADNFAQRHSSFRISP